MANPLTLFMPIIPNTSAVEVLETIGKNKEAIDNALTKIGTVHFARFLILDTSVPNLQPTLTSANNLVLAVITSYDGDFDAYISDFVSQIGFVFNALLGYVVNGSKLIPVADNLNAFTAYVAANDASQNPMAPGLYSAYPYTVQQILAG